MMRLRLVLLLLFFCARLTAAQNAYNVLPCAYHLPDYSVECGRLTVPESRTSNSGTLELAVVIVHSRAEHPAPDPLVYLAGRAESSTPYTEAIISNWLWPFLETRDVILVDQRGTGRSIPSLACDDYPDFVISHLGLAVSETDFVAAEADALQACQEHLTQQGIDTRAYTSAENAADLNDLRQSLNLETWNLLGVSYGTRLALTMLRDHPQGIRSVILNSVYPPQVNLYATLYDNIERARQSVFAACAADMACAAAYPDLEAHFWSLIETLTASPVTVTIPLGNQDQDFVWTGARLYELVFLWLYVRSDIASIPAFIDRLWQGQFDDFEVLKSALYAELSGLNISMGLYMSVQCGEERPASMSQARQTLLESYPRLTSVLMRDLWLSERGGVLCRQWQPTPPSVFENTAIVSDIPVLLLSGGFDPITPPMWAELAAQTLSQSQSLVVPNVGHGVMISSVCATQIAAAYLNVPMQPIELACVAQDRPLSFTLPPSETTDHSPRL